MKKMLKLRKQNTQFYGSATAKSYGSVYTYMMVLCSDSGNRLWRSMLNLRRRPASRWSTPASRTGSTTSGAARKLEIHILVLPQIPGDDPSEKCSYVLEQGIFVSMLASPQMFYKQN